MNRDISAGGVKVKMYLYSRNTTMINSHNSNFRYENQQDTSERFGFGQVMDVNF